MDQILGTPPVLPRIQQELVETRRRLYEEGVRRKAAEQAANALTYVIKHAHEKIMKLQQETQQHTAPELQARLLYVEAENAAAYARLQAAEVESAQLRKEVEKWQGELVKQREMYSNALAQSEKLAQAELTRRMKEATDREMVLVKALESLKEGSSSYKEPMLFAHPQDLALPGPEHHLVQVQDPTGLELVEEADGHIVKKRRRRRRKQGSGDEGEISDPDHRYSSTCVFPGCDRHTSYGFEPRSRQRCSQHVLPGMRNVKNLKCHHPGCMKTPTYNFPSDQPRTRPARCSSHKLPGMVDVNNRSCTEEGCTRQPSFGFEGDKRPSRCAQHKLEGMYDIRSRLCSEPGCKVRPLFGFLGEKFPTRCKTHMVEGMQNILHIRCGHPTCRGKPVMGFEVEGKPLRCVEHALENMVDLRRPEFRGMLALPTL